MLAYIYTTCIATLRRHNDEGIIVYGVHVVGCTANDSKALQNLDKQILYFRIGYYTWHVCIV